MIKLFFKSNFAWLRALWPNHFGRGRLLADSSQASCGSALTRVGHCQPVTGSTRHSNDCRNQARPFKLFREYFSDEAIVAHLCRERIKLAELRHDKSRLARLAGDHTAVTLELIDQMVPPHAAWNEARPKFRANLATPNLPALHHALETLRQANPQPEWVLRLQAFIDKIRERVLAADRFDFRPPTVKWKVKDKKTKKSEFRSLCQFDLEDNLIIGLVARYLRELLDIGFEDSSYAFRVRPPGKPMPTHHTAFDSIYQFRTERPGKSLFVAECDIRGFYDAVDHEIALAALDRTATNVQATDQNRVLDPRARELFQAYLRCYSFPENVRRDAEPRLKRRTRNPEAHFPWPEEALRKHQDDPLSRRIGVPQGGAISCVIANLVLDLADKRVQAVKHDNADILYHRYCDDMILIAIKQEECQQAFDAYLAALHDLKLPYHPPKQVMVYDKTFWDAKSKQPYCWTGKTGEGHAPWVQFVGYQVRYDGLVRIKKQNVEKQILKLRDTTDQLKFGLQNKNRRPGAADDLCEPVRATKDQAASSLEQKLVAQSVGHVKPWLLEQGPRPMCWANGFKALHGKPFIPTFLKQFDRERERQIRRFKRAQIVYGPKIKRGGKRRRKFKYFTASYCAQFKNMGGVELILNPYRSWHQELNHRLAVFRRWVRRLLRWMGFGAYAKALWQPKMQGKACATPIV
jgi:hypothetical protein